VLRAVSDFILEREALRAGKNIVGDKSPNSLLDDEAVRLLQAVYPDARLVFIVRDGRDAALSQRFQSFIDTPRYFPKEDQRIRDDFTQDPEPYRRGGRSVFTEKGIRRAAENWVHNVVETDRVAKELFDSQYFCLRYEDLLAAPWQEMSRLWSFLQAGLSVSGLHEALDAELLQNPDKDWQHQKAGEIAQGLQKGKHGSWREMFTTRDREVFHEVAAETLKQWGYSPE
jgi:hypothetical protein